MRRTVFVFMFVVVLGEIGRVEVAGAERELMPGDVSFFLLVASQDQGMPQKQMGRTRRCPKSRCYFGGTAKDRFALFWLVLLTAYKGLAVCVSLLAITRPLIVRLSTKLQAGSARGVVVDPV
jgi:hypothetical protein